MGIQGLLPQLRSIMKPIHVQDLRGQTVAVDTYSWLHKGAVYCSLQLCKGILTTKHIEYCMHRVKLLQHHGVKPILVFDGGLLPMKIDQETKRARKRKENLERALEQEAAGNFGAASDCYQKAVDISPSIAFELIQVLKQENVDYIVAPYEADAQMTFLSMYKHADAVITEDSDLIPFGCSRIIFKMDKFGHGVEFQSSMLEQNRDLDFTGFSKQMILEMCIFSGCDYLPSLPGMGLKRAHAIIRKYKSYEKVIKHLRYSGVPIPTSYEGIFKQAVWAFQHQRVYDPEKECLVHLSDVPQDTGEDLDFLGPWLPPDVAKGIAQGNVDPFTKSAFQVEIRSSSLVVEKAFSMKNLETADKRNRLELPVQKNVLTNYFCLASIQAKRKFKAPKLTLKVLMKPSCPSSNSPISDSPGSDETPLSFASNQSQDFPVDSTRHSKNELMEDGLPNRCYNSLVSLPANPKPHEEHGTELKCVENKSVKRKVSTSPYFSNALAYEDTGGHQNKENCAAVLDHQPASLCEPNKTSSVETSIKKRKTVHIFDKETLPLENVFSTPAFTSGQDERIAGSYKENRDEEGKKFGRDISHVKDYCGIAEKSMERFATLMNSFRYNSSSGSRASGLRPPPPKDVQNIKFSVSSNKKPLDFSQFSYKPPEKID